jgi:hypothetical protein
MPLAVIERRASSIAAMKELWGLRRLIHSTFSASLASSPLANVTLASTG